MRCYRIEHWMHLRCVGIRQEQYTDTWTCHLHRESRPTSYIDITPPYPSRPWSKPPTHSPPTTPTPPQPKQSHTSNTPPVLTGLVNPNPLIHSPSPPLHPRRPEPKTYTSHTLHQLLIHSTSAALDTIPEPRVPPTCPALTTTTPHPSPTRALPSPSRPHTLSAYTHATHKQPYTHHSHSNHRINIGYHDNLTADQRRPHEYRTQTQQ